MPPKKAFKNLSANEKAVLEIEKEFKKKEKELKQLKDQKDLLDREVIVREELMKSANLKGTLFSHQNKTINPKVNTIANAFLKTNPVSIRVLKDQSSFENIVSSFSSSNMSSSSSNSNMSSSKSST